MNPMRMFSVCKVMTKATTDYLYVNLSASQTRKRLKGYGFGVRKVEAVDRNQAVIIHTATRDHLRELESLFADVMPSASKSDLDTPIENLRNLGPTRAA
jgi:DNA transformation protein